MPVSRVCGVATFYHFFTLKPKGKHTCVVCTKHRLRHIKGAATHWKPSSSATASKPGETPDGNLSLLTARCLGSCGLAPAAAMLDNAVLGKTGPADIVKRIEKGMQHDS